MRPRPLAALLVLLAPATSSAGLMLPGTASAATKLDAGFFPGGAVLDVAVTGTLNLLPQTGFEWITNPDGSLVRPVTDPTYGRYANAGSTQYPTAAGGDGVNRFPGGGANYDTAIVTPNGPFGFAGRQTTDTTHPGAIRFGAAVYTFRDTPGRADWLFLGFGGAVTVPAGGVRLYLAVQDSNNDLFPGVNSGAYAVEIAVRPAPQPAAVPEPSSWALLGGVAIAFRWSRRTRQRTRVGHAPAA